MVDYADSSQLIQWLFKSPAELRHCRAKANLKTRQYLFEREEKSQEQQQSDLPTAECFASGYSKRIAAGEEDLQNTNYESIGPHETASGNPFLTPDEEAILVSFYASKLPSLIGPNAQVPRLRRESKVTATAALLYRRFFLSNSVMIFDPKAIMVAAAFLGSKVEDATADVRYLEEGTALMNAPVDSQQEIIPAEIALLAGTHFELLCFHSYKAVVALTEDLRTFLKSEKGKQLLLGGDGKRPDLIPIYDGARRILDEVVVSDIPLLYSPGQVGMAALILAQERLPNPSMDLRKYLQLRFPHQTGHHATQQETLEELTTMLSQLETSTDLVALKAVHKKLKKVRVWGKSSSKNKNKKKKESDLAPPSKRQKTEA
jgi:cyclin H